MKTEEVILMRKMEYSPESDFNVNYDGKSMVILSCGDKESREIIVPPTISAVAPPARTWSISLPYSSRSSPFSFIGVTSATPTPLKILI